MKGLGQLESAKCHNINSRSKGHEIVVLIPYTFVANTSTQRVAHMIRSVHTN